MDILKWAFRNCYLAALLFFCVAFSASAQNLNPVVGPGQIHERIKASKTLILPIGKNIPTNTNVDSAGAICLVVQGSDTSVHYFTGRQWQKIAAAAKKALDSAYYNPVDGSFRFRYSTGQILEVYTGLVDSLALRMKYTDTAGLSNRINTKEPIILPGTTAQYWRGDKTWQALNISAIPSLQDSLLAKPTYTAADARYVPQTRTLTLTAGSGISITGGTQSLAANRTWTVTNTGILNQLATQETKDFRISGYGYVGKLRVGYNATTTIPTNIYSAYNSGADSHAKFVSFFKANETGADSTGTIQFVRIDNNTINLSDPDYANSYVKSGTFIGQVVGTGAIQDQSVASGAISLGKPVVKLTMHAESDFTSFTAATASLRGYFKTNAETVATEKWRIQPNGFMGLMTNNPQATIHAKGLSASTGSVLRLENSAGTILYEVFNNNTTQNTGAQINAVVSTGVNRTIQATDYIVRATAAGITITIPVPTAIGRYVVIKNRSGGNITVAMTGGATIDGSGTSITVASGDVLRLSGASGTDWDKL